MSASFGLAENLPVLLTAEVRQEHPQASVVSVESEARVGAECGGNGFVWTGAGHGDSVMVVTSASWLVNVLKLKPLSKPISGIEWKLTNPNTVFHVIYQCNNIQTNPKHKSLVHSPVHEKWSKSVLSVAEAQISSVHLLPDVYHCLTRQLSLLGQWRCEVKNMSVRHDIHSKELDQWEGRDEDFVSVESLFLPLSCIVFLKVKALSKTLNIQSMRYVMNM